VLKFKQEYIASITRGEKIRVQSKPLVKDKLKIPSKSLVKRLDA
jgi:hypothetical protein